MRVSTSYMYEKGSSRISDLQSKMLYTQNQMAAGRKILTPSDDPVAASRALEITQLQSVNSQYAINRQNAKHALEQEEGVLQSVTELLQGTKTQIVQAGNGALDNSQRSFIAAELRGRLNELLSLANNQDGTGSYLFAGFQTNTAPFSTSATGAQYAGDQGQRMLQVGQSRHIALGDPGQAVFENIKAEKAFVSSAAAANTGTGVISPGTVIDSTLLKNDRYAIDFAIAGGITTYQVFDITTDPGKTTALTSGNYTSGQAIEFDGMRFSVTGAPADGDTFSVQPAGKQSVFTTINNLIELLETPVTSAIGQKNLEYGLSAANANLGNALDNVLTVRASVGSRLKELDTLDNAGEDRNLQYEQALEDLQGLDYVKAVSELMEHKSTLEAAQQSFAKVAGLSLFNYIS